MSDIWLLMLLGLVMLLLLGVLTMPPLVLGREERRGGNAPAPRSSGTGVVDGDGAQGRWNWPGGRFWKGFGKRSGVAGVEGSLCASGSLRNCCRGGSRCGGGAGGVRGGSSKRVDGSVVA